MLRGIFGSGGGAAIGGGGTSSPSTIPRWTGPSTLGDSGLIDNGTAIYTTTRNFGIGTASPVGRLDVVGGVGIRVNEDGAGTKVIQVRSNFAGVAPAINVSTNDPLLLQTNNTERMRLDANGNVGIGTVSPGALLDVNTGTAAGSYVTSTRLSQTGTAANSGQRILFHNSAQAWDQGAIGSLREGANNNFALTFFTSSAGTNTERARIDSSGNVNVGGTAAGRDPVATRSLAVTGGTSLAASLDLYGPTGSSGRNWYIYTGGTPNNALQFFDGTAGVERMRVGNTGGASASQVAIGTSSFTSGRALTTVADLDVFGVRVGRGGDASQTSSVAVGPSALGAASTGAQNTAVGFSALSVATGANNTAIGSNTLSQAFSGNNNTAIGVAAILPASSTASGNTAVGMEALRSHTSGNSNTAIGWRAGYGAASANANTTGSDNIYVGRETVGTANNNTNEIVIGAGATGNGSNTATLGNSSTVGIHLDANFVRLVDSYTVGGTLPAAGTVGRIARVTNGAAAQAWGATIAGGGTTNYLVWDNGTNWTVFAI